MTRTLAGPQATGHPPVPAGERFSQVGLAGAPTAVTSGNADVHVPAVSGMGIYG